MKTSEEFLKEIEEILYNGVVCAEELDITTEKVIKKVLQFRKEGMKKAWKHSYYECDAELQRGDWVVAQGSGTLEENFEEWYNQNKEA